MGGDGRDLREDTREAALGGWIVGREHFDEFGRFDRAVGLRGQHLAHELPLNRSNWLMARCHGGSLLKGGRGGDGARRALLGGEKADDGSAGSGYHLRHLRDRRDQRLTLRLIGRRSEPFTQLSYRHLLPRLCEEEGADGDGLDG